MSRSGSKGWYRTRSDNPLSSVVIFTHLFLSWCLFLSRITTQPWPPPPKLPLHIGGVFFCTGWTPAPLRTPAFPCFLQIFSTGKYCLLSEDSYLLPRAPSADTVAGWFSGKAAGFRSTAGSLAGHVLCLSLWSEQRLFPSLGLGWGCVWYRWCVFMASCASGGPEGGALGILALLTSKRPGTLVFACTCWRELGIPGDGKMDDPCITLLRNRWPMLMISLLMIQKWNLGGGF